MGPIRRQSAVKKSCQRKGAKPSGDRNCKDLAVALQVRPPWVGLILQGRKRWELRSQSTHRRGRIGLVETGTSSIVGEVTLKDCIFVGKKVGTRWKYINNLSFKGTFANHRCTRSDIAAMGYEQLYAWVFCNCVRFNYPLRIQRKQGAITWLQLDERTRHQALTLSGMAKA